MLVQLPRRNFESGLEVRRRCLHEVQEVFIEVGFQQSRLAAGKASEGGSIGWSSGGSCTEGVARGQSPRSLQVRGHCWRNHAIEPAWVGRRLR